MTINNPQTALLFHGTGGSLDNFWFPWLKTKLESHNFSVTAPQLPEADVVDIYAWRDFVLQNYDLENATLIGHSAGANLILALLEKLDKPITKAILVAGFYQPLTDMPHNHPTLVQNPNWQKIKQNCAQFYFVHSDNDPWGCNTTQGVFAQQHLGGELTVKENAGHFGSQTFHDPCPTLPVVADLCAG